MMKPVYFLHIPKTAGTTMHVVLHNQYRFKKRLIIDNYNASIDYNYAALNKQAIWAVYGHTNLDVIQNEFNFKTITLLRDPRERLISQYLHFNHLAHTSDKYTLKQGLKEGRIKNFDNCQVRFLGCKVQKPFGEINEEDLKEAMLNLKEKINLVGVVKYFEEMLVDCSKLLNWRRVYYYHANRSKGNISNIDFDTETEELIRYYNRYDQILYDFTLKMVEERINSNRQMYDDAIRVMHKWNKLYNVFKMAKRTIGIK